MCLAVCQLLQIVCRASSISQDVEVAGSHCSLVDFLADQVEVGAENYMMHSLHSNWSEMCQVRQLVGSSLLLAGVSDIFVEDRSWGGVGETLVGLLEAAERDALLDDEESHLWSTKERTVQQPSNS